MKYGVIIAARTDSSRLPGKALLPLKNLPMIVFLIRRIRASQMADMILFATTSRAGDDRLASVVASEGIPVFRGADIDVVKRYVDAAGKYGMEYVVRVTGDCPLIDAESLDFCLTKCDEFGVFDLASTKTLFPVGIDFEIYQSNLMTKLHRSGKLSTDDREHLTKYFYDHREACDLRHLHPPDHWAWREKSFTIDTPEDYRFAQRLVAQFDTIHFSIKELIQAAIQNEI